MSTADDEHLVRRFYENMCTDRRNGMASRGIGQSRSSSQPATAS